MIKFSSSLMMNIVTKLLVLLVIAKSISLGLWWFLPSDGVELQMQSNYKPKYQRVDFVSMVENLEQAKSIVKQESITSTTSIENMILKALYGVASKGFAVVALKSSPTKTSIVSIGEEFSGYILKTIYSNCVVFTQAGKDSTLFMDPKNKVIMRQTKEPEYLPSKVEDKKVVSKTDISFYTKNLNQIWKDISINEVKVGNEIKGFKVDRINKTSKMYQLGLQVGDMIVEVNNVRLKSYKDALDVYKDINKLSSVQIIVLRNNTELELVYEIN